MTRTFAHRVLPHLSRADINEKCRWLVRDALAKVSISVAEAIELISGQRNPQAESQWFAELSELTTLAECWEEHKLPVEIQGGESSSETSSPNLAEEYICFGNGTGCQSFFRGVSASSEGC